MNQTNKPPNGIPPELLADIPDQLAQHGFSPRTARAMIEFDSLSFIWKQALIKGELPRQMLDALQLDLDLAQFQCLTAILRIQKGIGRDAATPATIGLVAQELNIDPSRASRMVAGLVARGYLERRAAQDDGRKSIVVLTALAGAVFARFRDLKWARYIDIFSGWDGADIETFVRLFERYSADMRRVSAAQ